MAQTTIASIRNFQSLRNGQLVLPQFQDSRRERRQQQQRRSTVVTTQNWYFGSLTELLNSTYAVFPQSLRLVGSFNIGSPLPSIVIKYTQLNSATAGIAKLPISIKISRGERVNKFGDDACFTLNARRRDYIGIADGVGGWRQRGYDPSAFSTSLMTIAKDIAQRKTQTDPYVLMDRSYKKLLNLNRQQPSLSIIGSSTVCLLAFDHETGLLETANLGDSGFLLVRNGRIITRSQKQTHNFNTPKQLAYAPPTIKCVADHPRDASQLSIACRPGDLIITATDGLFDNINDAMILAELAALPDDPDEIVRTDLESVASSLATLARRKAIDKSFLSPFSLAARQAGFNHSGGKVDDITVIVSSVSDLGTEV